MRERKYNRYRKEKRLALTILAVLVVAVLAFVLVFSLTAKKDGNPLSSLTPEMNGSLDMNTGSSVSSTDKTGNNLALPANTVTEVGSVPSTYNKTTSGTKFTASVYQSTFATFKRSSNLDTDIGGTFYMDSDVTIDWNYFGSKNVFIGTFDGNGHTITISGGMGNWNNKFGGNSGESVNGTPKPAKAAAIGDYSSNVYAYGLFGRAVGNGSNSATIKNLKIVLENTDIKAGIELDVSHTIAFGILTGWLRRGTVENVSIELKSGNNLYLYNSRNSSSYDNAIGLFAGIAGNDNDNDVAKFYNVQSIVNGNFEFAMNNNSTQHVGLGGLVGSVANIDVNGAIFSGSGYMGVSARKTDNTTVAITSNSWRMMSGFVGMSRVAGHIKAPTSARYKMQNLISTYGGSWSMCSANSGGENYGGLIVGDSNQIGINNNVRIYTPYSYGSSTNNSYSSMSEITTGSARDIKAGFAGRNSINMHLIARAGGTTAVTHINVKGDANLKTLYEIGSPSTIKVIATPLAEGSYTGATGVTGATFNSAGQYADLSSVSTASQYTIEWTEKFSLPVYTTGWLTDFGKIPYGYNGIPDDATAISTPAELRSWATGTNTYGYLTKDIDLTSDTNTNCLAGTLAAGRVLDGAGHTITIKGGENWAIRGGSDDTTLYGKIVRIAGGLFNYNEGTIKNLTVRPQAVSTKVNTAGDNGKSLIDSFVVGVNRTGGKIENVSVYVPSGAEWRFHCNATDDPMYDIFGSVAGVNEGYVGYCGLTNEGSIDICTGATNYNSSARTTGLRSGQAGNGSNQISIIGGVVGLNLYKAEYLTSHGNASSNGIWMSSASGTRYLGSVVGASCSSSNDSILAGRAFVAPSTTEGSANYLFSGYTGIIKSTVSNSYIGSVAGYLSGTCKGINWAVTAGTATNTYGMTTSATTAALTENANKRPAIGAAVGASGSASGGFIRTSVSGAGAIHGYYDYFYNDGSLHLEFENPADLDTIEVDAGSNVTAIDILKEFEVSKAGLDTANNNIVLTTPVLSAATAPSAPVAPTAKADVYKKYSLGNHGDWIESIALAGSVVGQGGNYSPNYVAAESSYNSKTTSLSLPLTGSNKIQLSGNATGSIGNKTDRSQPNSTSDITFSGVLDGNGNTLTIDLGSVTRNQFGIKDTTYDSSHGGWFGVGGVLASVLNNAVIKNIHIVFTGSMTFSAPDFGENTYFGLIAGMALGNTKIINSTITFSSGTVTITRPTGSYDLFFGGLFGMLAGNTRVEKSIIKGNGGSFYIGNSNNSTTIMGVLAGRVATTNSTVNGTTIYGGYENLILTGTHTSNIDGGSDTRVSTVFGTVVNYTTSPANSYYYYRNNINFYESTFAIQGKRSALFAQIGGSDITNESYINIKYISDSISFAESGTSRDRRKQYYSWSGTSIGGANTSLSTLNDARVTLDDNKTNYHIRDLSDTNVIAISTFLSNTATAKANNDDYNTKYAAYTTELADYNTKKTAYDNMVAAAGNVTATVKVDGKSYAGTSVYFSKASKLFGSEDNYYYRGFVRYGIPKGNNTTSETARYMADKSTMVTGTATDLGTVTLTAQFAVVGYATQSYGQSLDDPEGYFTVYASFGKIQAAHDAASENDKEYYKALLARSAGVDGVGITSIALPEASTYSFVKDANDATREAGTNWLAKTESATAPSRVKITTETSKSGYIFRTNDKLTYRLEVTPEFIYLKGLVTEYVASDYPDKIDVVSETEGRGISDGNVDAMTNGKATLYGEVRDKDNNKTYVYFGLSSNASKVITVHFDTAKDLYDDLAAAKTAISSGSAESGWFEIPDVGSLKTTADGKEYVSIPNCSYAIVIDNSVVKYHNDNKKITVGSETSKTTVALYRFKLALGGLTISGEISDNTAASGWKPLTESTLTQGGSYVPGQATIQNFKLSIAGDWGNVVFKTLVDENKKPVPGGGTVTYTFADFGVGTGTGQTLNFGKCLRFDGNGTKTVKVSVSQISVNSDAINVSNPVLSGTRDSKYYDGYKLSALPDVKKISSVTVGLKFDGNSSFATPSAIHSNFHNAIIRELLGANNDNYTFTQFMSNSAGVRFDPNDESIVLDEGTYNYCAEFSLATLPAGYTYSYGFTEGKKTVTSSEQFTVYPLPLSFTYTPKLTNLSQTYSGQRIDFMSASASLSDAAKDLIKGQYTAQADKDGAVAAVTAIVNAMTENQFGIRYLYAADAGEVNTMFADDYNTRFGATYATKTYSNGTVESGPINAGTYYFSGYIIGNKNFVGLTNDYKDFCLAQGVEFDAGYFEDMSTGLKALSAKDWGIDLSSNNGYADAFGYAAYSGSDDLTAALTHYLDLLQLFAAYPGLFEQSAKEFRTVSITRATVSVYVKDSAIEYGSVAAYTGSTNDKGPVVANADYVITDLNQSTSVTIRIDPKAFTIDGTTYRYLPVKLADPNNPESAVTAYRNALYVDGDVDSGNPNIITTSVAGNLTVVRKEITVEWSYVTSDPSYQTATGVYKYTEGAKHTMTPTYNGILNNDALDFDIIGDGDMETVGVHKILTAFSNRNFRDSCNYNYYLGESATGYFTVSPINISVNYRYYTDSDRNSVTTSLNYLDTTADKTLYTALTIEVNGTSYWKYDGVWVPHGNKNKNSQLNTKKYPADDWFAKIKSNLSFSHSGTGFGIDWKASSAGNAQSFGEQKLAAPTSTNSEYVFTVNMDGFVSGNYSFDMHETTRVLVRRSGDNNNNHVSTGANGWNDKVRQKSTTTTITMNTTPGAVLASSVNYLDNGNFGSSGQASFSDSDYAGMGYIFDGGEAFGTQYWGLFCKSGRDGILNRNPKKQPGEDAYYAWSRYTGFSSIIYSMADAGRGWSRVDKDLGEVVMVYFNVNLSDPTTAAIARNGGINVAVGGNAVSAGHNIHDEPATKDRYNAGQMVAGIAVNDYGNNGMRQFTRQQIRDVFATGCLPYPTTLQYSYGNGNNNTIYGVTGVHGGNEFHENVLYGGSSNAYYHAVSETDNYQAFIYASNATVNTSTGAITLGSSTLTRKTMVSSASGESVLKGDSFRVNLYGIAQRDDYENWGRGLMLQFGNIQIALSKADSTAPSVSAPYKYGNAYRFTVTDNVGVDTASVKLNLIGDKKLTMANGGIRIVDRTFTNGLLTSVTFETHSNSIGVAVGADKYVINKIIGVSASDIRYAGSQNTATFGFSSNGSWGRNANGENYSGLSANNTNFIDYIGPVINITHVGLDNYAENDNRWKTFTADDAAEQARAQKYITATWKQQNYLWLKYSAGTGKIPCAEVTWSEYNSATSEIINISKNYSAYVGTVVTGGRCFGFIRVKYGSNYKNIFFDTNTGSTLLFTKTTEQTSINSYYNLDGVSRLVNINANYVSIDGNRFAFKNSELSRVAVYDNGDLTGSPMFETSISIADQNFVYNAPAIRLEANTRYYIVAEDVYGNRSEKTLYFSMVDTADAAALSIVADPVELDDNNLIAYTGGSAIVEGSAADWTTAGVEKLFGNPANPRFGLDMESDGIYNYTVMLVRFSGKIHVAIRTFVDGKITYTLGTKEYSGNSFSDTYNAATGTEGIPQWLADNGFTRLEISDTQVKLYDTIDGAPVVKAETPMVINTDNYNSYLEDTWSNTSVVMRLIGSGESNSLARFYYRYAPDPNNLGAKVANGPMNENVTSNAHLFRNYGWIALPVTVDANGNVIVDDATSLLFEHTGIYRFEIKIELGAGQNAYLVYKDSFGNWVYNAYAEGGNIRAYKVDQSHYTTYDPYSSQRPYGGAEFGATTQIGYYTVKIDKRVYFLELKNYWYDQEGEDEPVENYDPNIGGSSDTANTEFATIDILKWNKDYQDYTTPLIKAPEGSEYAGAYNVGMSSASNKNTWVRLDIRSHIQKVGDKDMWYAVYKILADVYVGDTCLKEGVDLPLGSEMNRYEVGKAHNSDEPGTNNSIAIRRLREMAINMPDPDINALENVKLVYRVYYKYYYSFVINYAESYASYYGSTPQYGLNETAADGTFTVDKDRVTPISGNLITDDELGSIRLKPVELIASDGSIVNFNYSSFAILEEDEDGSYHTTGYTVTRTNDRGIATTENISGDSVRLVSRTTPAGQYFYAISGVSVTNKNTENGKSIGDYVLMFQRTVLREQGGTDVVASMTGTQVQFASDREPYSFYGFALAPSDKTLPDSANIYNPTFNDSNKVNSVVVNGTEYFVTIVNSGTTFATLHDAEGHEVGGMSTNDYGYFTVNGETFSLSQLMVYDGEGHQVGTLGNMLSIEGTVYTKSSADPYYTVEKAFINVSKAGNFLKYYDGTNNYIGGSESKWVWNSNKYAFYYNNQWVESFNLGASPLPGLLTEVEIYAYYVGSDSEPQANVSKEDDVTYLKMFLPDTSNYRFATVTTKHTVQNGHLVSDGDALGVNGFPNDSLYKTADAGEIVGHDAPVTAGVMVSSTANWSSIMIPDTSYANTTSGGAPRPNRTDGVTLSAASSISTILARPVDAKSEVKNNDTIYVTFNGAAQGGSAIRIVEDAANISDTYGTLPGEVVVFTISDGDSMASPILAGTYNFNSVTPNKDSIGIANIETGFGAINTDSIPENYYVNTVSGERVSFKLNINTLENSFALNRVVKSDGSGYELRITISNLKQSIGTNDGLDFINLATTDDSGAPDKRYMTTTEFGTVKSMIAAGGKFEGENALGVGENLKNAERYYELIETGTQLLLDETNMDVLSENEKELRTLHAKLSGVLEYRFQCALGKVFKSANNGSDNFYNNMPDFREGRFSDWNFDERTGKFTLVFKGNVNLDTDFFSDRYSMRVTGLAGLIMKAGDKVITDAAPYSTNSSMSASSLADGQIERYDYKVNGSVEGATYISTQQELKDWLSLTDTTANGYAMGILVDNIFDFTWGYGGGIGGAQTGLAAGRTLNGNGYAIGIVGTEFNNISNHNMRLVTIDDDDDQDDFKYHAITGKVVTRRWSAGGAFLQYVNGTIENTNFVYRSTRKYDISDINVVKTNSGTNAYGLSVGIISGFAGNRAKFNNVSLDIKGQFYVDYIGTQLVEEAYIGVGGFAGYADNIASFNDCTVNYYYISEKTLDNGYTTDRYAVSATISSTSNYGLHLGFGGFAGITGGNGTAHRLTATTQVAAEYTDTVGDSPINAIYVGRNANSSKAAWIKAAGMFGFTTRTSTGTSTSSSKVSGRIDGIINKFRGRIAGYLANGGETDFGSIAGEVGGSSFFTNIYTYGTTVTYGKLVGSTRSSLPLIGTSTSMSSSIIHSDSLGIYKDDAGLVDYYFGGNSYDYYEEDGVKYFYETTKFINGNSVVYSPFDDYTSGTPDGKWTGWKLSELTDDGYRIYLDYERTIEVGFIKINADNKSGSFILNTTENGESTTSEYMFKEIDVVNQAGETVKEPVVQNKAGQTVIGMTVDVSMMTISDQNNTYYFSVPLERGDTNTPWRHKENGDGINIEVLAPAQSFVWEYHTTFYANNLGKTSAVSRVVWNLDQVGGRFDNNYNKNSENFVIAGKNEDTPFKHITTPEEVTWYRPALGQFQTMSSDSDGTIFQFVYDGQNHNNNISVTVTINGSKQTITADASVDMIDAGVYVVGTFDLGADTTYDGSSGYVFNTADRKGQSRNVTSPQLMVVIYPRVIKLVGGVAKQYDGTTVYEHVIKDELDIETDEDGNVTNETVNPDTLVKEAAAGSYEGILSKDKNGTVTVVGDFNDNNAADDKSIGFEKQSKREVLVYTDAGKANAQVLLTVKRGQDRKPIIGENGYPELTKVLYSFGNGNGDLDLDDDIPFVGSKVPLNTIDSVVAAFYAAIGQVDSVEEVRKAFAESPKATDTNATDAQIEAAILSAYQAVAGTDTTIATATIYNFKARVGGKNASAEAGTDTDEYYVHKTSHAVITKEAYDQLTTAQAAEYDFLNAYVYIAAGLSGDGGFNYTLVANGAKDPVISGKVGSSTVGTNGGSNSIIGIGSSGTCKTLGVYDKAALNNEHVKIDPRAIDVWFNGLYQSFYNDDGVDNYDYKDALKGVTVVTVTDGDGNAIADAWLEDTASETDKATAAAAIRGVFKDLPSVLTDEQVIAFYKEVKELTVEFNISDARNTEILAAFQNNEVKKFTLDVNVGGVNFAVNDGGGSQVKNNKNPVLTVCHYNGKVGEDGLPYVDDGLKQYLSITNRRDVLNLNYSSSSDEAFDYSGFSFYVEDDIDMNGAAIRSINWSTSSAATFDGGNHAITNFTVAQNAQGGEAGGITIGFFQMVSEGSVVKNLILADAEIAIYGQSKFTTEDGVTTTTITRVGGIAGANGGTIENVVFEGTIKRFPGSDTEDQEAEIGNGILGGIVGSNGGVIRNAFALANIETTAASVNVRVGSLAGVNVGTISHSYVVGKAGIVHGANCTVGSIVGQNFFTLGDETYTGTLDEDTVLDMSKLTGAHAYGATVTVEIDGVPTNKTTAELIFAGHTVEEIVREYSLKDKQYGRPDDASNTAPYGSAANPVKIHNFRQLEMALNLPYFYYEITEDIVFNTGFDEEKLDKVMGSGYGYGRIKIAEGKRIVMRYNEANEEVAIVAGATTVTASDAFKTGDYGSQVTQYGKPFYELVLTFFTV